MVTALTPMALGVAYPTGLANLALEGPQPLPPTAKQLMPYEPPDRVKCTQQRRRASLP